MNKAVAYRFKILSFWAIIGTFSVGVYFLYKKHRFKKYDQKAKSQIDKTDLYIPLFNGQNSNLAQICDSELSMDDFESQEEQIMLSMSSNQIHQIPFDDNLNNGNLFHKSIPSKFSSIESCDNDTGYCQSGLNYDDNLCDETLLNSSFAPYFSHSQFGSANSGSYCLTPSNHSSSSRAKFDHEKAIGYIDVLLAALHDSARPGDINGVDYEPVGEPVDYDERHTKQPQTQFLIRTLTTISDLAAFSENQVIFREAGCLNHLMRLLSTSTDFNVLIVCTRCIANLSLNVENQMILRECTPFLLKLLFKGGPVTELTTSAKTAVGGSRFTVVTLSALTNLAVVSPLIEAYTPSVIARIYKLLEEKNYEIKLNALKLLVNLSCYDELVPLLLRAKVDKQILTFLVDSAIDAQMLIRSTTLLEHLLKFASKHGLLHPCHTAQLSSSTKDLTNLPLHNGQSSNGYGGDYNQLLSNLAEICSFNEHSSSNAITSPYLPKTYFSPGSVLSLLASSNMSNGSVLKGKISQLKCHRVEDVRENACKIYGYLNA